MAKQLRIKGKLMHYKVMGQGPALILVHGFCEDSIVWEHLVQPLSDHFTVMSLDLPGYGRSEALDQVVGLDDFAHVVLALAEVEDFEHFYFAGHSLGAYIGLELMTRCPERFLGMALVNSHVFGDSPEKAENRKRVIEHISSYGSQTFVREMLPGLFSDAFRQKNRDLMVHLVDRAKTIDAKVIVESSVAMMQRTNRQSLVEQVDVPFLFISGKQDTTISNELSEAQALIPKTSRFYHVAGTGHMAMFECPKLLLDALLEFKEMTIPQTFG